MTWTWTGILTAVPIGIFALTMIWLTIERWKIYQPLTKVFCWVYAEYLLSQAYTKLYEQVSVFQCLEVAVVLPLIMCFVVPVMRLGDPFLIANELIRYRKELRERDQLHSYREHNHLSSDEHIKLQIRLDELDNKIETSSRMLRSIFRMTRKNKIEEYGKFTFKLAVSQLLKYLGL